MMRLMIDPVNDSVAAELRACAARKNITGAQIARNLDLPAMYVHRRLSANVDISVRDLVRLSGGIGVQPLDVLAQVLTHLADDTSTAPAAAGT